MKKLSFNEYKLIMEVYNESNVAFANLVWVTSDNEKCFRVKVVEYLNSNLKGEDDYKYDLDDVQFFQDKGCGIYDVIGLADGSRRHSIVAKIENIVSLEIEYMDRLYHGHDFHSRAKAEYANDILFYNEFLDSLDDIKDAIIEKIEENCEWLTSSVDERLENIEFFERKYLEENLNNLKKLTINSKSIIELEENVIDILDKNRLNDYLEIDEDLRKFSSWR